MSKSKHGLTTVSDMMASFDAQVYSAHNTCLRFDFCDVVPRRQCHCHPCRQVMHTLQASKNLIGDICALYGDLARMEQELLSKIPTTTVVDELCELA